MAYIYFNNNPLGKQTGDCTIRAISKLTDQTWNQVYVDVCAEGYEMAEMPSTNSVWGEYLLNNGYVRESIPNTCPRCYTIEQFCKEHPEGKYAVATGSHVAAIVSGNLYDAWDSSLETVVYYFRKE